MELLRENHLTPKELLFVRNNQELPSSLTLESYPADNWTLELTGLIDQPRTVKLRSCPTLSR